MADNKKSLKDSVEESKADKKENQTDIEVKRTVNLTPDQQYLASLVDSAGDDFPEIEVEHIAPPVQMQIPQIVKRPENSYRWMDIKSVEQHLIMNGGMWEIVKRGNHSHVPDKFFQLGTGAVMCGPKLVLCFTRKKITEKIEKNTIRDFDLKVEEVENTEIIHGSGKKEAVVYRDDKVSTGRNETLLNPNQEYGPAPD